MSFSFIAAKPVSHENEGFFMLLRGNLIQILIQILVLLTENIEKNVR